MKEFLKKLKANIFFRLGIIGFLILILLIPSEMVQSLIRERESLQRETIYEVNSKWGRGQTLTGPILSIPYDQYDTTSTVDSRTLKKTTIVKKSSVPGYLHVLPEHLLINGEVATERRYRSIYEVVVYNSGLDLSGNFLLPDPATHGIPLEHLHLEKAFFRVGISDLKGVENQMNLSWNGEGHDFDPGTVCDQLFHSGVFCPVAIAENDTATDAGRFPAEFSVHIDLKGSEYLYFTPVGKTTEMALKSDWDSPSFTGEFLPEDRTIDESGFEANWKVLHLNRNYPQHWTGEGYASSIDMSKFGVELFLPASNYQKSMRVAKYAILLISLTFLIFFFVEILNKVVIHPINYLLIGGALVVFYTLLLSFSELISYNLSYLLSAVATLLLITVYTLAIIKSKKLTALIAGFLGGLFAFSYLIFIQLENHSLLIGSIGVFVILAAVMYFSRKIDWSKIQIAKTSDEAS